MCLGAGQPKVFSFFGQKQRCPQSGSTCVIPTVGLPGPKVSSLLSQIGNAHACASAAICRACDPPRTLSLASTHLRTSRLCGSVCSGRCTLCDVLPTPSPASSSSTRVPRREPVLGLRVRRYPIHAHAARMRSRARVGETQTSERCGVLSQPLMPRCDAPLTAWRGPFASSL